MNNNDKMEKDILNSVYRYETKKTVRYYAQTLVVVVVLLLVLYGFGGAAWDAVVQSEIHTLFIGMLNDWKSFLYAVQAGFEMTMFAVPLWGQVIIAGSVVLILAVAYSVFHKRHILIEKMKHLLRYWAQKQ